MTAVARRGLISSGLEVQAQWPTYLDEQHQVRMRPDIVFLRDGEPVLIADAKYKRLDSGESVNQDLYQMLAYCVATGTERGLLIYPRHLSSAEGEAAVRNAPHRISQFSFALDLPLAMLNADEGRLVRGMRRLA